ncbi:hypothetical protein [Polaribacter sp. L3A8]|uniref:hypothetical protein n=1 Tax=Polaribacter sp. L3A8 TaxID=2686361 RepID=UPI00131E2204|nr:hypothetical protein [Polaribacter sp. L3A8]
MNFKNVLFILFIVFSNLITATERPFFDKKKDLLIAQFDSKPDPDDIHAQAALGSLLAHKDFKGVHYYAVAGAIGSQNGKFIASDRLFKMAFGRKWTNAHTDWDGSVKRITKKVVAVLKKGGKVWVQEAGQSNITADWVAEVLKTVSKDVVKSNVIVVQHSSWNEKKTAALDLQYVKSKTTYFALDDGNHPKDGKKGDRGSYSTPEYRGKDIKWITLAKTATNKKVRKLWIEADAIIAKKFPNKFPHKWSYIHYDGVDYSDSVEIWWIFNIGEAADSNSKFWERYVLN